MGKTVADKKSFNFVGGLNTEAGPLTYPPNTWQDGDNVVPDIDGSLNRRFGLNYETSYALSTSGSSPTDEQTGAFVCEEWSSVGGNGSRNFVVVQRGPFVSFYINSGTNISATEKSFIVDLTTYKAAGNPTVPGNTPISCASANGKLVITSADTDPILVSYDAGSDSISVTVISLTIRDLYGLPDGLTINANPNTLSQAHAYNLLNQGWDAAKYGTWFGSFGTYPSNVQIWTAGKNATDDFDVTLLGKQDFGSTPAPKGRFLLSLFNRDRSAVSAVTGITPEVELYRPTTCTFYSGRAWYAGTNSETLNSWVLFSQIADTDEKFGKCYQDADPTSEFISDLVDSDGGVIPIQGAGTILRLLPAYDSMLVFADNGVWQIVGGLDKGFSASSYQVKKLSTVSCINARAIVEAESSVYFWAADGIWMVAPSQNGLGIELVNITNGTIQSFYTSFPISARAYASGRYYLESKTIYWAYNSDITQDGIMRRFKKDSLLCLDLRLKAFYTLAIGSLSSNSPYVTDLVVTRNKSTLTTTYNVVDESAQQVVVGANTVVSSLTPSVLRNSEVRFMTLVPQGGGASFKNTFARFEDGLNIPAKFRDWYSADTIGTDYDAFILTGYDLGNGQGGDKIIQGLYCVVFLRRTETGVDSGGEPINGSSCALQARWDWTDSSVANKWSASQETYRHRRLFMPSVPSATFIDGYPVVVTKNKIRGRGRSLQLKFTAASGKDMQLLGWAVTNIGNTNV